MQNKALFWALIVIAVTALLIHAAIFFRFTIDDAYITFAYSKNLASGNGLVFTRGMRVEATSSMLWAILLTPFEVFLHQGAVVGSKILGVLSALGTLIAGCFLVPYILKSHRTDQLACLLYAFLLAGASPFIVWATYGMENGLVALLLMLSVLIFLLDVRQGSIGSAFVIFLLETVRPEGFIYIFVFVTVRLILAFLPGGRGDIKPCIKWLVVLGTCLAIYEGFGFAYYGHLLPNTVHLKVDGLTIERTWQGIRYLLKSDSGFFYSILLLVVLQLVALRLWFLFPRDVEILPRFLRAEVGVLLVSMLLVLHWLFTILVGGDWMTNTRFLSHAIPLLLILLVVSLWQIFEILPPLSRSPKITALMFLVFLNGLAIYSVVNIRIGYYSFFSQAGLQKAEERALTGMVELVDRLSVDDDAVLACSDVGRPGYFYKGRVLDWWGLADEKIAGLLQTNEFGSPAIAAEVLNRKPNFIVLYSNDPVLSSNSMREGMAIFSRGFYHSPDFLPNYNQIGSLFFVKDRWHVLFQRRPNNAINGVKE